MNPQRLSPSIFRYRVMQGDQIIGQFSNLELAIETVRRHRGTPVVFDISVNPPRVVFKNGQRLDEEGK